MNNLLTDTLTYIKASDVEELREERKFTAMETVRSCVLSYMIRYSSGYVQSQRFEAAI